MLFISACKPIVKSCIISKSVPWAGESAANWQGSLARGFPGAAGREEQQELDQSLHDGDTGEAERFNNSVSGLMSWAEKHRQKSQSWMLGYLFNGSGSRFGGKRGRNRHVCAREQLVQARCERWFVGPGVLQRLPPRCWEGEGDPREPQPHYFYVQLPNYYVSAVCWKERCTVASRLGIYSD